MSDNIELIIKIPEKTYKALQVFDINYGDIFQIPPEVIVEAIANGTPLTQQETCANIPFLLHKEFGCPLDECVKAYDVAVDYLRSQGKVKG